MSDSFPPMAHWPVDPQQRDIYVPLVTGSVKPSIIRAFKYGFIECFRNPLIWLLTTFLYGIVESIGLTLCALVISLVIYVLAGSWSVMVITCVCLTIVFSFLFGAITYGCYWIWGLRSVDGCKARYNDVWGKGKNTRIWKLALLWSGIYTLAGLPFVILMFLDPETSVDSEFSASVGELGAGSQEPVRDFLIATIVTCVLYFLLFLVYPLRYIMIIYVAQGMTIAQSWKSACRMGWKAWIQFIGLELLLLVCCVIALLPMGLGLVLVFPASLLAFLHFSRQIVGDIRPYV